MSIMDMFKTKPADTNNSNGGNTNNNGNPSNGDNGKTNLSDNPPATGKDGKIPGTSPDNQNPLDIYAKMFDNANADSEIQAPSFKLDPKTIKEVSSKMDFTKGIAPETLQKATSGDVNALMDIIKTVGQNSYGAAIEHTTALTDTHLAQRMDFESQRVNKGVKDELTKGALASATPNFNHPVIKNELTRVAKQFAAANPDASPQEIATAAKQYIADLQGALNPSSSNKDSTNNENFDWEKYLSSDNM